MQCDFDYHQSNKDAQYDARGIFLTYTCPKCHKDKMKGFRQDVLTDSNYWTDEDVEESW